MYDNKLNNTNKYCLHSNNPLVMEAEIEVPVTV